MSAPALRVVQPVPGGPITGIQAEVIGQALADAIEFRRDAAGGWCADCEAYPSGLCLDHATDLDRADDYLALARELGLEVKR
jgi:hypothetical protein